MTAARRIENNSYPYRNLDTLHATYQSNMLVLLSSLLICYSSASEDLPTQVPVTKCEIAGKLGRKSGDKVLKDSFFRCQDSGRIRLVMDDQIAELDELEGHEFRKLHIRRDFPHGEGSMYSTFPIPGTECEADGIPDKSSCELSAEATPKSSTYESVNSEEKQRRAKVEENRRQECLLYKVWSILWKDTRTNDITEDEFLAALSSAAPREETGDPWPSYSAREAAIKAVTDFNKNERIMVIKEVEMEKKEEMPQKQQQGSESGPLGMPGNEGTSANAEARAYPLGTSPLSSPKSSVAEIIPDANGDICQQGLNTDASEDDEDGAENIAVAVAIGFLILTVFTYLGLATRAIYQAAHCGSGEAETDIFSDGFVERQRKIFAMIDEKNKNAKILMADLNKIKKDNRDNPLHYTKVIQALHKRLTKAIALEDAENERRNKLKKRRRRRRRH